MALTLTKGATVLHPLALVNFDTAQKTGNIVHPIIGTANGAVTFAPAELRTGTFEIAVPTLAAADAVRVLHLTAGVITLAESNPAWSATYVPSGSISVTQDSTSRKFYIVSIDWTEVVV